MPITIQPAVLKYKTLDGEYKSVDCLTGGSSDKEEFVPVFTQMDLNNVICDKTYEEVYAAVSENRCSRCYCVIPNSPALNEFANLINYTPEYGVIFGFQTKLSEDIVNLYLRYNPDGTITTDPQIYTPFLTDVEINGASIVNNGVANVPVAGSSNFGVTKIGGSDYGISMMSGGANDGRIYIASATSTLIKAGTNTMRPVAPNLQHESIFYGLAKLAGADMASSSNAVGTFTEEAKQKIMDMLEPKFRTIADFTATEDISYYIISTDLNGLPFNLREIMIEMQFVATDGSGNGGVKINNNNIDDNCYLTIPNAFSSSDTTTRYANIMIRGGRLFGESTNVNQTSWWTNSALHSNKSMRGLFECDGITNIRIYSLNTYKIATGSKIKIIGR